MIKVFHEVATLDKKCYEMYHLSEDLLMEHAALGLKNALPTIPQKILIVAGTGNNGADGIALARQIQGYHDVFLYLPQALKSPMAKLQEKRAKAVGVRFVKEIDREYDVVVDALFGSGISRPLDTAMQELIMILNQLDAFKIACDIPSGIGLEGLLCALPFVADKTVTMGAYKEVLFLDEVKDFVGEIVVADLGVDASLYRGESDTQVLEATDMRLPHRLLQNTHKGHFGHLAVVAGKKQGAGVLAARAALAFGAGLVTVVENEPYSIPASLMSDTVLPENSTAVCIGMGLGNAYDDSYLAAFVHHHDKPMLVDADLLYLPIMIEILIRKNLVITPHPKEFAALLKRVNIADVSVEELQKKRFFYARAFSKAYPNVTLLLKGANTLIVGEGRCYINPLGTSALSKGGSGDVLGGLIAGLLAQGYSPVDACITGSLAHALCTDKIDKNSYAFTPEDLIEGVQCL
jgi:hydroxyethylthiazole kinase-like uncharacterized protein yjeF